MRIHLDTDLGSDTDDACALAMLLGQPDVEVVGITTAIDPDGRRAGFVHHCLTLAGRTDIPVAAGAAVSMTTLATPGGIPEGERYWPAPVPPRPSPPGRFLDLLELSIDAGATVVAIGPYTNLALLEVARPGSLGRAPVVVMGGWIEPPAGGLPQWGPSMDWNVQCDTRAAAIVAATASLTLVTLSVAMQAQLRARDLPRLRAAGPLGRLLADQAAAYADDNRTADLAGAHPALPADLLNMQYDGVACAVAAGWPGATVAEQRLTTVVEDDVLRFAADPDGRLTKVVVDIDGPGFEQMWLDAVERAAQRA